MLLIIGNKNYSSWSLRPWLAMKVTGMPFDEKRIHRKVPVLHDGSTLGTPGSPSCGRT